MDAAVWTGLVSGAVAGLAVILPVIFKRRADAEVEKERALTAAREAARADRVDVDDATRKFIDLLQKQTSEDRARITTLEESLRELRGHATKCMESLERLQKENVALREILASLRSSPPVGAAPPKV